MFATLQKNITTAGTPEQLSATSVPIVSGLPTVIKAKQTNTGSITIGNSSSKALNTGTGCFRLTPGQAVSIRISDLNEVWLDTTVNAEGIEGLYEPLI